MRVLWLCNTILPMIARALSKEVGNKEGWITGLALQVMGRYEENRINLGICFPLGKNETSIKGELNGMIYYGFPEDTVNPEQYDSNLEEEMSHILEDFKPDIVHIFGSEYPHALAMTRSVKDSINVVLGLQGICSEIANSYVTGLPSKIQNRFLFRDFLKHDNIRLQQKKYELRGKNETLTIQNVSHILGRTAWDKEISQKINPKAEYHKLNETLRPTFYQNSWKLDTCEKHSIFMSQANYPLKGLHFLLAALPMILEKYSDVKVYVAGDKITGYDTFYEKIKIGSYGKYCYDLIKKQGIEDRVIFLGKLSEEQMCDAYLKSHLFLSASTLENSPNSVGEAMLLGMPVVSSLVGGVPSILKDGEEGLLYSCEDTNKMAELILKIFADDNYAYKLGKQAHERASLTHDPQKNYESLLKIYNTIGSIK